MRFALAALLLMSTPAFAQDAVDSVVTTHPADQGIGASVGIAGGGRSTPGGLRIAGHYLYQLSSQDWFDGVASFTFGGDSSGCYRDDMQAMQCNHSATSGSGVEIGATVRRMFGTGDIVPFARAGLGVQIVRYRADDVTGVALPLHLGGGIRAKVAPAVAVVAQGELDVGVGAYTHGLGEEPLLGLAITAGAEFELR
ncbi:MAG TPA: hypothetical protein VGM90_03140 [Kofleriaceae bacterium]|jgi:opacity protein-like surface antigen